MPDGPLALLASWRRRMQRLTSVSEQLKRREVRVVLTVLQACVRVDATDVAEEVWKQNVMALLRRWKAIDIELTEATVEAKASGAGHMG
jgi:dynein heavy chain